MTDSPRREPRPSRPYGGEPGARPRGRDAGLPRAPGPGARPSQRDPGGTRPPGRDAGAAGREPRTDAQTRRLPAAAAGSRSQPGGGRSSARARRDARRSPGLSRWGTLQGGLGVCIIVSSAAVGTIATVVTRSTPGLLLGLF
ncbi:MAG TPA: hypothetical protein VGU21_03030, partial [Streptosporangiaceae bacterium]|nr:hypothetical protein [Streptosporangiaceae bacterium]